MLTDEPSSHIHTEGLRVRLSPNNVQRGWLTGAAGASRFCWNWAVAQIKANQEQWTAEREGGVPKGVRTKPLSFRDLQVNWQEARNEVACWHATYPSKLYLYALMRAARAHRDWMTGKSGFPRFKSRHRSRPAFTVSDTVRLEERHLVVWKGQRIRITGPDNRQKQWRRRIRRSRGRIVSATISRDATGHWWASLTLERTCGHNHGVVRPGAAVGVDVGVKKLVVAATAGGEEVAAVEGARHLQRLERRVRRAQRAVSRKDLHWSKAEGDYPSDGKIRRSPSHRRDRQRAQLARLHRRARDARSTLIHQTTAALLYEAGLRGSALVVEDLNVAGMGTKGGAHKKGLNRSLREAALSELRRQLAYKTQRELGDSWLVVADRWYPSSKTCARCGKVKAKLSLNERIFRCDNPECGHVADRDLNAATNLAAWGETELEKLQNTQAGDRHRGGPTEGETPSGPSKRQNHPSALDSAESEVTSVAGGGASQELEPSGSGSETAGTPQRKPTPQRGTSQRKAETELAKLLSDDSGTDVHSD